jgi:hypothetical protein
MAKYERFEDLPVWQEAARLYNAVLALLEEERCPLSLGKRYRAQAGMEDSSTDAEDPARPT